jgi:hypothetical protein
VKKKSEKKSIEGTLTCKNLPWWTKGKNLKKKILKKKNFNEKKIFLNIKNE